jgi:hypothetical protein
VLQWLRAHGCDWSADSCAAAATHGHLSVPLAMHGETIFMPCILR